MVGIATKLMNDNGIIICQHGIFDEHSDQIEKDIAEYLSDKITQAMPGWVREFAKNEDLEVQTVTGDDYEETKERIMKIKEEMQQRGETPSNPVDMIEKIISNDALKDLPPDVRELFIGRFKRLRVMIQATEGFGSIPEPADR